MTDATNIIDINALLALAMKPKAKKKRVTRPMTSAERKRAQRIRVQAGVNGGRAPLTAETINHAILDALAIYLRQGDPHGHAEALITLASQPFLFAPQAANVIRKKLYGRVPRVMGDLEIDVRDYA